MDFLHLKDKESRQLSYSAAKALRNCKILNVMKKMLEIKKFLHNNEQISVVIRHKSVIVVNWWNG